MFRNRSVIEIMVLWFTFIVGFVLLATGATISFVKVVHPEIDVDRATDTLFTAITIVLGALLGMLSAKGITTIELSKRLGEDEPHSLMERERREEELEEQE